MRTNYQIVQTFSTLSGTPHHWRTGGGLGGRLPPPPPQIKFNLGFSFEVIMWTCFLHTRKFGVKSSVWIRSRRAARLDGTVGSLVIHEASRAGKNTKWMWKTNREWWIVTRHWQQVQYSFKNKLTKLKLRCSFLENSNIANHYNNLRQDIYTLRRRKKVLWLSHRWNL